MLHDEGKKNKSNFQKKFWNIFHMSIHKKAIPLLI